MRKSTMSKAELCSTIEFMVKNILADKAYQYKKVSNNLILFSSIYAILFFSISYLRIKNIWLVFLMAGLFFSIFFISLLPNIIDINDYLRKVEDLDVMEEDMLHIIWPPMAMTAFLCTAFEASKYLYFSSSSRLSLIAGIFVLPYFLIFNEMVENEKKAKECTEQIDSFKFEDKEYEELIRHGYFYYVPAGFMIKVGDMELANTIMTCNKIREDAEIKRKAKANNENGKDDSDRGM